MTCPDCGYMMSAFEKECSRCQQIGKPSPAPPPSAEPPTPPPVAFVPSPYPTRPPGAPVPPMPVAVSVFLGIILAAIVMVIVVAIIGSVNQQSEHDREIDSICGRITVSSGMSMSDCRAQIKAQGF